MCYLNEICRRPAKLEIENPQFWKPLSVSENLIPELLVAKYWKLKVFRNKRMTVMENVTGKTVGIICRKVAWWKGLLSLLKIKIPENFSTAMIVKILREQSDKKINTCKKYSCKPAVCLVSQHSAKLMIFWRTANLRYARHRKLYFFYIPKAVKC